MAGHAAREGLLVDLSTGVLRRGRVLAQEAPKALLFLGFGARAVGLCRFATGDGENVTAPDEPCGKVKSAKRTQFAPGQAASDGDPFLAQFQRLMAEIGNGRLAKADGAKVLLDVEDRSLRRLVLAEWLTKAGYDPDEPRDARGRWTDAGSTAGATTAASALGRGAASFFGEVGPEVLAGLAELGASFAAPVTFLGTLFVPTNSGTDTSGALPNRPHVTYHYDIDTGTLTLSRGGEPFYSGHAGADGSFHDENGRVLGHGVDGSLVLDPDALPGYLSSSAGRAQPRAQAEALSQVDTERNEPKLCPDPEWDRASRSSAARASSKPNEFIDRAAAYQFHVTGLPAGLAVKLTNPVTGKDVYFDGCRDSDGTMLEAKGPGCLKQMIRNHPITWQNGILPEFDDQALRQTQSAGGRPIEWHFAEKEVAGEMRKRFEVKYPQITVIYDPSPWEKQ
jgi:hypothetical protein